MPARQVLYSASQPISGAALASASYESKPEDRGLVPYFVSGPLSRSGMVGFVGTVLHVLAWVLAIVFDSIIGAAIHQDTSPGAFTYWLWGILTLAIGLVALLMVTILHATMDSYKIPEGGAPPFLMTMFIGGAQISLMLTVLQMIASSSNAPEFNLQSNTTHATGTTEYKDERNAQRNLMVWSMIAKVYIVQFLKNNQEWAGPAGELKKQTA